MGLEQILLQRAGARHLEIPVHHPMIVQPRNTLELVRQQRPYQPLFDVALIELRDAHLRP